ncbi:hypothetical protein HYC85_016807 [Camellia sinensis]|uniref:E3 ubiquitin-protein ligase RMA n=1 Tax=Camellia sinensis TaxID=4442 RepID=A0A7J7H0P7_CAMSI|nr:hypothetical protein HYC85_016807 [Camellia sinensis]
MDNNLRDDVMDLDLNQEPLDQSAGSVLGLESILNELETAHGQIEQRIRQLEAVTARARQRQRWRQARNPPETSNASIEIIGNTGSESTVQNMEYSVALQEGIVDRAKSSKRDRSHLVAMALESDTDVKKLPYVYSTAKECPVCKGEVTDRNITPIYGNGKFTHMSDSESSLKVPPRPQAHRIESIRQQRVNRGISHIPVVEALRRIRMGIGATGERERQQRQDLYGLSIGSNRTNMPSQVPIPEILPQTELGGSRRLRSRQFSRVLSESADSLLSISSSLNNAERLFDDLESYINNHLLETSHGQALSFGGGDTFTGSASVVQPEHQTVDSTAEINTATLTASSSERIHVSTSDVHLENLRHDTATEINLTEPRPSSSSSRRRIRLSRVLDVDNGISRESRRRRLACSLKHESCHLQIKSPETGSGTANTLLRQSQDPGPDHGVSDSCSKLLSQLKVIKRNVRDKERGKRRHQSQSCTGKHTD